MDRYFAQLGKLISGVHRLNSVVDAMNIWLGGSISGTNDADVEIKFQGRTATANIYFSTSSVDHGIRRDYQSLLTELRDLDFKCQALGGNKSDISDLLRQAKDCHFKVADVIERLNWTGINTEALRMEGNK